MIYDAIIIGGGAAGLFCAAQAGQRGKRILVLEKAQKPGKKILISGGGRCNFTNIKAGGRDGAAHYLSQNPHFAKSALSRFTPGDFIALVDRHNIAWHEKTLGQLFCNDSAQSILQMLADECAGAQCGGGVTVLSNQDISTVEHAEGSYLVQSNGTFYGAHALVIASGGPSIPKMGASHFAYDLARQFGLKIIEPRPALVPLTLSNEEALFRELSGISAEVEAHCGKQSFRENALFTHRGLSGPAILQISSFWRAGEPIFINFLPDHPTGWLLEIKRTAPKSLLKYALRTAGLSERLAAALAEKIRSDVPVNVDMELGNMADATLRQIESALARWRFAPSGSEGFAKAEVTLGGIDTKGLSSQTMEAKQRPGLFAIGEAVDVTGWLGGYNFQWAWASGWAAAQAL